MEKWLMIFAKQLNLKKWKMVILVFCCWHFATTKHCNLKFWKIDPPYCTVCLICRVCKFHIPLLLFYRFILQDLSADIFFCPQLNKIFISARWLGLSYFTKKPFKGSASNFFFILKLICREFLARNHLLLKGQCPEICVQ